MPPVSERLSVRTPSRIFSSGSIELIFGDERTACYKLVSPITKHGIDRKASVIRLTTISCNIVCHISLHRFRLLDIKSAFKEMVHLPPLWAVETSKLPLSSLQFFSDKCLVLFQRTMVLPLRREFKKAISRSQAALIMVSGPQDGSHRAWRRRSRASCTSGGRLLGCMNSTSCLVAVVRQRCRIILV